MGVALGQDRGEPVGPAAEAAAVVGIVQSLGLAVAEGDVAVELHPHIVPGGYSDAYTASTSR